MASAVLLRLARSDRLRRLTTALPVTRAVVERFVAGETDAEALIATRALLARGLTVTIDRLGEDVVDRAQADATAAAYVGLLASLARDGLVPASEVSLKLSAMGQALAVDGPAIALANARVVCAAAAAAGTTVSIDMEDHTTVDATLATVAALRRDFPWVAAVVQAALRRTPGDLAALLAAGSRVRLVKGAYDEPGTVAYRDPGEIDAAYRRCLRQLLQGNGYPQIATHDPALIEQAQQLAREQGRSTDSFEFQLLYGVRPGEQTRLVDAGHRVRVYLPFGADWYGYFMRRLAERPANVAFFARALIHR